MSKVVRDASASDASWWGPVSRNKSLNERHCFPNTARSPTNAEF